MRINHVCADCNRRALFKRPRKGFRVKRDKSHSLCFRHFRDEVNRDFARRLRVDTKICCVVQ